MPLEYPKFLPLKGAEGDEGGIVVHDAEEEAAAIAKGHVARESVQPAGIEAAPGAAPIEFLEYPKHVYRGEGEGQESIVVKNAEEEAAALEDGYRALDNSLIAPDEPADEEAAAPKSKKRGGKK